MKEINIGQVVSLIHCKNCGAPIEIYPGQEFVICDICKENNDLKVKIDIDNNKDITFRGIQKHAQCIRCINRNQEKCKNKDKFLVRHCYCFVPRTGTK